MTDLENALATAQVTVKEEEEEDTPEAPVPVPVPEAAPKSDDATGDASTATAAVLQSSVVPAPAPSPPPPVPKLVPTAAMVTSSAVAAPEVVAAAASPPAKPPPAAAAAAAAAAPALTITTRKPSLVTAPPAPVPSMPPTSSSSGRSSKSKKKKSSSMGPSGQGENTGRWTAEEHRLFLEGLEQHGKGWKKIASLIKSRTVVQIRTHAQKYFQKLAKARQNGEEGVVIMEGRGGLAGSDLASVSSATAVQNTKRRNRQTRGTKRKAIQSVVASVQRQAKKLAMTAEAAALAAQDDADDDDMDTTEDMQLPEPVPNPVAPLPAVAPTLAHFVLPHALQPPLSNSNKSSSFATSTSQGTISGPALEDSIFRFLTPAPVVTMEPQVNDVARQAGANPITLPTENPSAAPTVAGGGEVSPTGVMADLSIYPSWTDAKDIPTWYAKGADVDALLDVGDALDWLADTGDMHETYQPPPAEEEETPAELPDDLNASHQNSVSKLAPSQVTSTSVNELSQVGANVETVVPPLPSIFDGTPDSTSHLSSDISKEMMIPSPSAVALAAAAAADPTTELQEPLFDTPIEEHDFVSTILEESESAVDLAALS